MIYSGNSWSRLLATQLSARLAYIQPQRHLPEEHKYRIDGKDREDWRSLRKQELELKEAIHNYSILASNSALDNVECVRRTTRISIVHFFPAETLYCHLTPSVTRLDVPIAVDQQLNGAVTSPLA